jgi:hypothetical protein
MSRTIRSDRPGFALASTIASLFILLLTLTLTIANIRRFQPNLELNGVARTLAGDIRSAQEDTITEQVVYGCDFDIAGGKYSILKIEAATTTVKTVTLPASVSFLSVAGLTDDQVWFNPYGAVRESGEVVLRNTASSSRVITIKPSGYVQLSQ